THRDPVFVWNELQHLNDPALGPIAARVERQNEAVRWREQDRPRELVANAVTMKRATLAHEREVGSQSLGQARQERVFGLDTVVAHERADAFERKRAFVFGSDRRGKSR